MLNKVGDESIYKMFAFCELSIEFDRFKEYLDRFLSSQYLFSYQRNSSLSKALINVYSEALKMDYKTEDVHSIF